MNLLSRFIVLFSPVILYAGETISIALNNNIGQSSYSVKSDDAQNLRAQLIFPFHFYTIDIIYKHHFKLLSLSCHSSFLIEKKDTVGEDYDWQNNNLTVYSKSNNKIDQYYSFGTSIEQKLLNNLKLSVGVSYKALKLEWSDTINRDYVQNDSQYLVGTVLKFEQVFYTYAISLKYRHKFFDDFVVSIKPSLLYVFVNTKDSHLLRSFYTIQNIQTFAYRVDVDLSYNIALHSNILISLNHEKINKDNVPMNYYSNSNIQYSSYSSSYSYVNTKIGLTYNYVF